MFAQARVDILSDTVSESHLDGIRKTEILLQGLCANGRMDSLVTWKVGSIG